MISFQTGNFNTGNIKKKLFRNSRANPLLLGHQLQGGEKSEVEIYVQTCSNRITLVRQAALMDQRPLATLHLTNKR